MPEAPPTSRNKLVQALIVTLLAMALYATTWDHQFALDDSLFITGNRFTQQGTDGLADIWTTDAFIGAYGETIKLPAVATAPSPFPHLPSNTSFLARPMAPPSVKANKHGAPCAG